MHSNQGDFLETGGPGRVERRTVLRGIAAASVGVGAIETATTDAAADGVRFSVRRGRAGLQDDSSLSNRIEIRAVTDSAEYRFRVSGTVELGGAAGDFDRIVDGNTVEGRINTSYPPGFDDYRFSGRITAFEVVSGRVRVIVNGTDVTDRIEQDGEVPDRDQADDAAQRRCVEFAPIAADRPAAEFYDYRTDPNAENPFEPNVPSSLEQQGVSRVFVYQGGGELCLFVVHGADGGSGGAATFEVSGLPSGGEWVVLDDDYEGEQFDTFDLRETSATLSWVWGAQGRHDGAVFCGLGSDFEITIDPRFNEAAQLEPRFGGQVQAFQLVTGSVQNPQVVDLPMDQPVVLRTGGC